MKETEELVLPLPFFAPFCFLVILVGIRVFENCRFLTGDDCIAGFDNINVTVRNCYFDEGLIAVLRHVDNCVFEKNTSNGEINVQKIDSGKVVCDETTKLMD